MSHPAPTARRSEPPLGGLNEIERVGPIVGAPEQSIRCWACTFRVSGRYWRPQCNKEDRKMAKRAKTTMPARTEMELNVPGFNAEASIYKSSNYYQAGIGLNQGGGILPQYLPSVLCGPCLASGTKTCCSSSKCTTVPCSDPCSWATSPMFKCICWGGIWDPNSNSCW